MKREQIHRYSVCSYFYTRYSVKSAFVIMQGAFLRGAVEKSRLISLVKYPILV